MGSSPTRPTCSYMRYRASLVDRSVTCADRDGVGAATPSTLSGHIEQLPGSSWHARVYTGKDPLTGRETGFRYVQASAGGRGDVPAECSIDLLDPAFAVVPERRLQALGEAFQRGQGRE